MLFLFHVSQIFAVFLFFDLLLFLFLLFLFVDFLYEIETLLMLILEFLFVIHHPSLSLQAFLLGHDSLTEHVLMTGGEG